ncbi:MAG: 30S ribosome-binding factor RbfA [Thermoanaerobaculia bacterium]
MSQRTARVSDLIRRELSEVIVQRLQDPRVRLATVSRVHVTRDLKRAIVQMSILGDDDAREEALEGLEHARGFLRSALARRLRSMKVIPDLIFELDRGAEYSANIEDVLESLHDENQSS